MINNSSDFNSNIDNDKIEYNHSCCAGKNCKNTPSHHLKLVLIKKPGWFCEKCKKDLEKDDLVQFVIEEYTKDNKRVSKFG